MAFFFPVHSDCLDLIGRWQPSVVKAFSSCTSGNWWLAAAQRAPNAIQILVHGEISDNPDMSNPEADADATAAYCDANPGVPRKPICKNEKLLKAASVSDKQRWVDYMVRWVRRCKARGLIPVVGEINSGHPNVPLIDSTNDWLMLQPVDDELPPDGLWGLHEYWGKSGPISTGWFPWTMGRHMTLPFNHKVVIDEIGYDGYNDGNGRNVGWSESAISGYTPQSYCDAMVQAHRLFTYDSNVIGSAIFLVDHQSRDWYYFDTLPMIDLLVARLGECDTPLQLAAPPKALAQPLSSYVYISQTFAAHPGWSKGLDFAAYTGTDVLAAAPGWVDKVEDKDGISYGLHVQLNHGSYFTLYAHLQPGSVCVSKGQWVEKGQRIARSDNTGNSTGPHLHFEVQNLRNHTYPYRDDPQPLIFGGGVPVPGDPLQNAIGQAGQDHVLPLNPEAAFEIAGAAKGYLPASTEYDTVVDGVAYRSQIYRHPNNRDIQFIVFCEIPNWNKLIWFEREN